MKTIIFIMAVILWICVGLVFGAVLSHMNDDDYEETIIDTFVAMFCWPILLIIFSVYFIFKQLSKISYAIKGFLDYVSKEENEDG